MSGSAPRGVSRLPQRPGGRPSIAGALTAAAQPVCDATTRAPWSAELLTRLLDSQGRVRTDTEEAIRAAEADGSIAGLDAHVLGLAISLLRDRSARFPRVQVNLSARSLLHPGFLEEWLTRLRTAEPGGRLLVELSAESLIGTRRIVHGPLHALAASGALLALDDVTGAPEELDLLRDLPIAQIKLEGATVQAAAAGRRLAQDRVAGAVHAARWRGVQTVAKSVETEAQLALARAFGADLVQGHLTGRPVMVVASRPVHRARPTRREPVLA